MSKDETICETSRQYCEGAITAKEMLNKIMSVLDTEECEEFWTQFNDAEKAI